MITAIKQTPPQTLVAHASSAKVDTMFATQAMTDYVLNIHCWCISHQLKLNASRVSP